MISRRARPRDLRLVPVVAAVWPIAALTVIHPTVAVATAAGLSAAALILLALACRPRSSALLAVLVVGAAFGAAVAVHVAVAEPERSALRELPLDGGRSVTLEAAVVGKIERSMSGLSFDAVVQEALIGDMAHRLSAPVRIRLDEDARVPGLDLGSAVAVRGTAFVADPGDRAVLIVQAADLTLRAPPAGVLAVAADLRRGLQRATHGLPSPGAGLIAGLSVGDTSAVDPALDEAMKASSLSHLTAVSGANCALVVGAAFGIAALFGAPRSIRVGAGAAALIGFVVLVSPEPSVVRASVMAIVAMTALLLGRVGAGVSVLCVSVVVLLVLDPWLSLSLAFALSASATAALLVLAGPLAEGMTRWMPEPVALIIAVPLSAQLACGPLLVLIAPTVPMYGVLANIVAAPAAPVATMIGLLACLCSGLPVIASGLAALSWLPAAWIAGTATALAALPGSAIGWAEGLPGLVALVAVGAAIAILLLPVAARSPAPPSPGARPRSPARPTARPALRTVLRAAAAVTLAVAMATVLAFGPVSVWMQRLQTPPEWSVAACDVGQGDAILLRSAGRIALVDTGPDAAALSRCLDRFGVARVDLLVLTHFDLDHRGGVAGIVGRVDLVLHGPIADEESRRTVAALVEGGARAVSAAEGLAGRLGDASWSVLWPARGRDTAGNDASIVVEVDGGEVPRTILLGDLSAEPQAAVAARVSGSYDIVKVAHHGSADQHAALYERIRAPLALLTVGENTYGHPRAETIALVAGAGAVIARTDRSGAIAVWRDNAGLRVWRERGVGTAR